MSRVLAESPEELGRRLGIEETAFRRKGDGISLLAMGALFMGLSILIEDLARVALIVMGLGLATLGVLELTGTMARWRWRSAARQVLRLSDQTAVRWRFSVPEKAMGPVGLAFVGSWLVLAYQDGAKLGIVAALFLALGLLYLSAVSFLNVREVRIEGDKLVYSSTPFRHPRDRSSCPIVAGLVVIGRLRRTSRSRFWILIARVPGGIESTLTKVSDQERMEIVSRVLNRMLARHLSSDMD